MARPDLPPEAQAEIEQAVEKCRKLEPVLYDMLFHNAGNPSMFTFARSLSHHTQPARKPANLKLQLQGCASSRFAAEANVYRKHAANESELRCWLVGLAERIETEVMDEFSSPDHEFHCNAADRRVAIADALKGLVKPKTHSQQTNTGAAHQPEALTWQDIEIRFLDEFHFQEFIRDKPKQKVSFSLFGLEDRRRGGGKPRLAWTLLRALARAGTQQPYRPAHGDQRTQKRFQELRDALQRHFKITDDPLPFQCRQGYQIKFKLSLESSDRS